MSFEDLGLLFFSVLMLSLLFTPLSIRLAHRFGALDRPVNRSVHTMTMPRMGGLGMGMALLIGLPLYLSVDPILAAFLVGLVIITLIGMADDIWRIHPGAKMAGQLVAGLIFIEISDVYMQSFGNFIGFGEIIFSGIAAKAITLFCLLGVINAFNLSDGLDGLAAGLTAIACFFFAALALDAHTSIVFILSTAIFAATLGFLKYNSYPATLFMGDTGSLMLGYSVGCLAVMLGSNDGNSSIAPITIAAVVGLPIVDTLWVMVRRMMRGKNPFFPDNMHIHHRLLALGLPHSTVVSIIYICMMLLGFFALAVKDLPEYWQLGLGVLLMSTLYSLLTLYEYHKISLPSFLGGVVTKPDELSNVLADKLSRSLELLLHLIPIALCGPLLVADYIPDSINHLVLALAFFATFVFLLKRNSADKINIIYGIFFICSFVVLYVWRISSYESLSLSIYASIFGGILFVWSALKIKLCWRNEVLLTSSFEILLVFISWFLPYVILPALQVSDQVLSAAKFACLGAIPLFVAIKIVTRRSQDRDIMAIGLIIILCLIAIRSS